MEQAYLVLLLSSAAVTAAAVQGEAFLLRQEYSAEFGQGAEGLLARLTAILSDSLRQCRFLGIEPAGSSFILPSPFESGGELSRLLTPGSGVYGVSIREELQWRIGGGRELRFSSLGELFCLRECVWGEGQELGRAVTLYLDAGMEAGFFAEGQLVKDSPLVPENGWLYRQPLGNSIAERYASASGIRRLTNTLPALSGIPELGELARLSRKGDLQAGIFCQEFGQRLAELLVPWCLRFQADGLILGGHAWEDFPLITGALRQALNAREISFQISSVFGGDLLPAASLLFQETREPHDL